MQSAQLGISQAIAALNNDAQVVAQSLTASGGNAVATALVDSLQQKLTVEASASVIAGMDQVLGALIDVNA